MKRFMLGLISWCIVVRQELEHRRQLAVIRRRRQTAINRLYDENMAKLKSKFN